MTSQVWHSTKMCYICTGKVYFNYSVAIERRTAKSLWYDNYPSVGTVPLRDNVSLARNIRDIMMKIADKGCFSVYYGKDDAHISIAVSVL